jgi:hypothetical protein
MLPLYATVMLELSAAWELLVETPIDNRIAALKSKRVKQKVFFIPFLLRGICAS